MLRKCSDKEKCNPLLNSVIKIMVMVMMMVTLKEIIRDDIM